MKISRDWLQKYFHAPLPSAQELADALTFHAFEIESVDPSTVLGVKGDWILDVKITPNRGHDCLSYRGIAKEIAAILELPLTSDPLSENPTLEPVTDRVAVTIENPELCRRYIAGVITGVTVQPSPEWLVKRLEAMGQKSINNVVDATNFVMFNIGQPLHAFDAGKLKEKNGAYAIEIRSARENEHMVGLDEKEYALKEGMLVIVDGHADHAIGIAGVKGGKESGIEETTKDIILESANFYGPSVRKTAKALTLRTDASQRFEQVISPELASYGIRTAVELITKIAGGEIVGFADAYPQPPKPISITLPASLPTRILGVEIRRETIRDVFTRLKFSFTEKGDLFTITPPFERLDLEIAEDLVEEIVRLVGYDAVLSRELPPSATTPSVHQSFAASEKVREELVARGYSEVFTSVFAEKGERAVSNKIGGEKQYLRANLIDGLQEALKKNIPHKDLLGLKEVRLFEIGTVWKGGAEETMVGIVSEEEPAKEDPLNIFVKQVDEYELLPLSKTERYQSFSRFPSITRDIALWVPAETSADAVKAVIQENAGNLCVRLDLFDEFKKGERVSYAFRLVFQSPERTLTDTEANTAMERVYQAVKSEGWEVR